mmetsp:Transcript_8319/g.25962  ORF Transcript_8319/g.25962 Transcript_8319/m.25962 type:complete len:219 (-) Transcript_8319:373-1029(-)
MRRRRAAQLPAAVHRHRGLPTERRPRLPWPRQPHRHRPHLPAVGVGRSAPAPDPGGPDAGHRRRRQQLLPQPAPLGARRPVVLHALRGRAVPALQRRAPVRPHTRAADRAGVDRADIVAPGVAADRDAVMRDARRGHLREHRRQRPDAVRRDPVHRPVHHQRRRDAPRPRRGVQGRHARERRRRPGLRARAPAARPGAHPPDAAVGRLRVRVAGACDA